MRQARVRRLGDDSAADWDEFVSSRPDGSFFHLSGWRIVFEESLGHRCHHLFVERDGKITGVLPLVHLRSRLFGNALVSSPFCVLGGPVAEDPGCLAELDAAAADLATELGVDYLEYRLCQASKRDWPRQDSLYALFRRQLSPDPDAVLRSVPRKRRAMIRKAVAGGLRGVSDGGIERFYPLFATNVRNLGTPVLPRAYFECLRRVFGPACQITTVERSGQALSSVLSFVFRDAILPYHGGSGPAGREFAANDFMYWEVMRRACEAGLATFDFGRSKRGTGSFEYKSIWGFEPEPLSYEYLLLKRSSIPEINPLNPKYRLAISAWKRLPLPIANWLGPRLARNLG